MSDPFLVLLDRDGTINIDKHYLSDPEGLELLPQAVNGLKTLSDAGAIFAIVTNQSGIGRGYFTQETSDAINARLLEMLTAECVKIAHIATCPHSPEEGCLCRKPSPLLALQCAQATNLPLQGAYVIGDESSDVGLAVAIGAQGILISDNDKNQCGQVATVPDLAKAAGFILAD